MPAAALPPSAIFHVLHTNDFHNALTENGAGRLRAAVADLAGAPFLLLDAGDAIKAGNVGVNPWGEPILERMSALGYHALTLGNREFHVWRGALETKINRARFPVLCANLRKRGDGGSPLEPFVRFTLGGLRVVVLGVTVPMVTPRMKVAAALSSFVFDDPIDTARRLVETLRPSADVLIVLTHIGLREDERLARSVSGIDLIIGGHSHVVLSAPHVVAGTPIVQAGWHAHHFGHVQFTLANKKVSGVASALHPLQEKRR